MKKKEHPTEEKIKTAARKLFLKKGYRQTSVRNIATEAKINVSLMNYYFRSKEKLFEMIMIEYISGFFKEMMAMLDGTQLTVDQKVKLLAEKYIDLMIKQPDIPLFVLGEIRTHPESFIKRLGISGILAKIRFVKELGNDNRGKAGNNPLQLFVTLLGMTIFPFLARPMVMAAGKVSPKQFDMMMEERKLLVPLWFRKIMN